jgi:hypothetical protein
LKLGYHYGKERICQEGAYIAHENFHRFMNKIGALAAMLVSASVQTGLNSGHVEHIIEEKCFFRGFSAQHESILGGTRIIYRVWKIFSKILRSCL